MKKLKNYSTLWLIPLLLVLIMVGCDDRAGITYPPVVTTPTVSSTNPGNAAIGVPFNQKITATFSEAMNSLTITTATFTLMQGTSFVSGTVSYTGTTATFASSSNLAPNTAYTATITTMAKNIAGKGLAQNFVWSFTTGASALVTLPTINSTDPMNAAAGVPINQKIAATFSVVMDASTIQTSTFSVMQGLLIVSGFVSYSGTTATFAPASNLTPNTAYTVTITSGVKDLAGNAMANNYIWSFITGVGAVITPPTVIYTDPVNASTGVPVNQKIAATFSKTMDASTIQTSTFGVMQGTTVISGFVSYSGTTATFAPASNLSPNTKYTITITSGAKDLAGNALANNYVWSFTTGAGVVITPPTVISTDPANTETDVVLNKKITATFSKTMDPSTITASTFTLMQGITPISGFVYYSGTTATFVPVNNLLPNSTYSATITSGAKDLAGNAIANNYVWSFTTGAGSIITPPTVIYTDPVNVAISVALNKQIAATFSKAMDASTLTTGTFTLMQGTTPVSGFVSYSGITATFTPASDLLPNTKYTATITTGAKDLAGNPITTNYVWSFTTGIQYIVALSSNPVAGGTTSGGGTFNSGSSVTVTATPNAGYTFTNWTESGTPVSTNASYTFTLSGNRTLVANFTIIANPFTVALSSNPVAGGTTSGSGTFNSGSIVTVTAAPNAGYTFMNWTEGGTIVSTNANYTFTLSGNRTLVANFTGIANPPTVISTDPVNGATGVALNKIVTATFSKIMDASTISTLTFTIMQGVTPVLGSVSYSGTTATFTPTNPLSANKTYTATITTGAKDMAGNSLSSNYVWNFTTVLPYTVSLSSIPVAGGTTSGGGTFNPGSSVTVTATPNAGYTFTNWTEGGSSVSTNASYSFTLNGNRTLVANFAGTANPPTVISTDPVNLAKDIALNKKVTATFSKTMDAATITALTFTLKQGATTVLGSVSYSGTTATFTPTNPLSANTTYTATITTGAKDLSGNSLASNYVWSFTTVVQYTVTLSSIPLIGGTTSGGGTFDAGSSVTMTATPNIGYTFTNWTEGGTIVSTNASYTFTLSGNRTLVANFTVIQSQYTVILSSNPAIGGTTSGGGTFNSGASITVTATPNVGYTFTNWTEGGIPVSTNASYTFILSGNRTLVANFASTASTIDLGAAAPFGGFGGTAGLTNQGIFTVVNGQIGTTAASTLITGFHDAIDVYTETPLNVGLVTGGIFSAPPAPGTAVKYAIALQALADATIAYNYLKGLPGGPDPGAGELGGLVLAPGTYTAASGSFKITSNDLTLDAQGNPNAAWVFQMATSLTVGKAGQPRSIILVNGAQTKNIFWQVGSAATINGAGGGTMAGTIIAYAGVTFSTAGNVILTRLNGRALSLIASVTMVNTIINIP